MAGVDWSMIVDLTPYFFPPASLWPRWHRPVKKGDDWTHTGPMPFDTEFWSKPQFTPGKGDELKNIKGFITILPIEWTKGENNNIGYHSALLTQLEKLQWKEPRQLVSINQKNMKG